MFSLKKSITLFALIMFSVALRAAPAFLLWDSAVISNPTNLNETKNLELIYSTQPLDAGQLITTFVPIGASYRVMCCLQIKDGKDLTLKGLEKSFSFDPDFVQRVRSIKGPKYVYLADFLPSDKLNKHMKMMADSAGDTYYSAIGLVGKSSVDRIKSLDFEWENYGKIKIETFPAGKNTWRHKLTTSSGSVLIDEPSLPD
jgi:hypothetical protein